MSTTGEAARKRVGGGSSFPYNSLANALPQVHCLKPRLQPDPAAHLLILQRPRLEKTIDPDYDWL